MTERMLAAVRNPHTDVLGHCTGRMVTGAGQRPESEFDAEVVFAACRQFGVAVEINSRPERLDPPKRLLRQAVEAGCLFSIDTDAHAPGQLDWLPYGCERAVACGVPTSRVVNTRTADKLLAWTGAVIVRAASRGRTTAAGGSSPGTRSPTAPRTTRRTRTSACCWPATRTGWRPAPGSPYHPHRDIEVLTWVVSGALRHADDAGHRGVARPGVVQRMSAGGGVRHSEYAVGGAGALRADVGPAGRVRRPAGVRHGAGRAGPGRGQAAAAAGRDAGRGAAGGRRAPRRWRARVVPARARRRRHGHGSGRPGWGRGTRCG